MQDGISIADGNRSTIVCGTVFLALADTIAAHELGGFRVGVGFSLRKCRECIATSSNIHTKVHTTLPV